MGSLSSTTTTLNVSSMPPLPVLVVASLLFVLGIYVFFRWAQSYALMLKAMGDFSPVSPNWAYLLLVPVFNIVWICFLLCYVKNGLRKMHKAGKLSKKQDGGFIFGWGMLIAKLLACFFLPPMFIVAFVFWILSWIKLVEARKAIL